MPGLWAKHRSADPIIRTENRPDRSGNIAIDGFEGRPRNREGFRETESRTQRSLRSKDGPHQSLGMSMSALARTNTDPTRLACLLADATSNWELHAGVLLIVTHEVLARVSLGIPPGDVVPGVMIVFVVVETGLPVPGVAVLRGHPTSTHRFVPGIFAFSLPPRARWEGALVPENPLLEDQPRGALTLLLAGGNVTPQGAFRRVLFAGATRASDRALNGAAGQELRPRPVIN